MAKKTAKPSTRQKRLAAIVALEAAKPPGTPPKTKGEMLREAGYTRSTSLANTARAFNAEGLLVELDRLGVTAEKIAAVYQEAMQAKVVSTYRGHVHESDTPDHKMRVHAADKLADVLNIKKKTVQVNNVYAHMDKTQIDAMLGI